MAHSKLGLIIALYGFLQASYSASSGLQLMKEKPDSTNRVVLGHDVPQGEFVPYQVSLQYLTRSGEQKHFCGGSIISTNRVLTAGHCCHGINHKRMSVLAGVRSLNSTTGSRSQVTKCTIHESYMKTEFNDLAILNIDPPLAFSKSIGAIDISSRDLVAGNVPVTLTGWGLRLPLEVPFLPADLESLNFPPILQRLNYFTLENAECQSQGMTEVSEKEICARRRTSLPQGACIGDSGGPLVTKNGNSVKQVGIVSYGFRICGVLPDVYTRVSKYTKWIESNMA